MLPCFDLSAPTVFLNCCWAATLLASESLQLLPVTFGTVCLSTSHHHLCCICFRSDSKSAFSARLGLSGWMSCCHGEVSGWMSCCHGEVCHINHFFCLSCQLILVLFILSRVTTCLENLEMSGNLTAVREMSGIFIARQHTDAWYWYSKSVRLSVRPLLWKANRKPYQSFQMVPLSMTFSDL